LFDFSPIMLRTLHASSTMLVLCLVTVGATSGVAQRRMPGATRGEEITTKAPRAVFDILQFQGSSVDSTRVDVYIAVPYASLDFLYAGDKYVADYSVGVQITVDDVMLLDHYESFTVLEMADEHRDRIARGASQGRADAQQISFLMTPAKNCLLHLSIRDLSSRSQYDTSITLHVKSFTAAIPTMSDLLLYRDRNGMNIIPSIGPDVSELVADINDHSSEGEHSGIGRIAGETREGGIFAALYNMPPDSTLGVVTEIIEPKKDPSDTERIIPTRVTSVLHTTHTNGVGLMAPAAIPEMPLFIPLQFDELWSGHYTLTTYVLPAASDTGIADPALLAQRALAWSERGILVRIARGIPASVTDLDQAIAQLRFIATGAEWDSLSNAQTPKEKHNAIVEFWNQKLLAAKLQNGNIDDASRASSAMRGPMDVFYARVEYANAHFSTSFQPGWKSDRGHVYLALGAPDAIDTHSSESMQRPYEVWDYSGLGARYTFVDAYLLGDYRLEGAFPAPGTFIWDR
jgi:GWxTD domain-containing protein